MVLLLLIVQLQQATSITAQVYNWAMNNQTQKVHDTPLRLIIIV